MQIRIIPVYPRIRISQDIPGFRNLARINDILGYRLDPVMPSWLCPSTASSDRSVHPFSFRGTIRNYFVVIRPDLQPIDLQLKMTRDDER